MQAYAGIHYAGWLDADLQLQAAALCVICWLTGNTDSQSAAQYAVQDWQGWE